LLHQLVLAAFESVTLRLKGILDLLSPLVTNDAGRMRKRVYLLQYLRSVVCDKIVWIICNREE
jgi:hypothetical protein